MAHAPQHYVSLRIDETLFKVPKGVHADVKHLVAPYGEFAESASGDKAFEEMKENLKRADQKLRAKNKNISDMQKEIKELKKAASGGE